MLSKMEKTLNKKRHLLIMIKIILLFTVSTRLLNNGYKSIRSLEDLFNMPFFTGHSFGKMFVRKH